MYWLTCTCRLIFYQCTVDHIENIDSLTQASIFSPPQLVSSLLDSVAEVQHIQVSTRRAAVNRLPECQYLRQVLTSCFQQSIITVFGRHVITEIKIILIPRGCMQVLFVMSSLIEAPYEQKEGPYSTIYFQVQCCSLLVQVSSEFLPVCSTSSDRHAFFTT